MGTSGRGRSILSSKDVQSEEGVFCDGPNPGGNSVFEAVYSGLYIFVGQIVGIVRASF
jgi:hypothetical protein